MRAALRILPLLLLSAASPGHRYTIDASRSDVSAKVAFFGIGSKTARFPAVSGGIILAEQQPQRIDLEVVLDATALTATDSLTRDRVKGPRLFPVAQISRGNFPGQTLVPTRHREAEVTGQITARGVTRPATLKVRFATPPQRADGRSPLLLTGETTIDRRDFGMTSYPVIVGRMVRIVIRAALVPAA